MIEVEALVKRFGQLVAVDDVSFKVERGEIFGLLGPNGAGKTTTIRCLLTLIRPTSGKASVSGLDVTKHPQEVRQISGYVPQDISVDGMLTGYENLLFYGRLFHVPGSVLKKRIQEVLAFLELSEHAKRLVKDYSGGMMRRLEIGQVLVNRPQVLFLDEPSIGLDPAAKRVIWDYVNRLRAEYEVTILLTTQDMNEAEALCDRLAIMNSGKLAVIGSPEELKGSLGGDVVTIAPSSAECAEALGQSGYRLLSHSEDGSLDIVVNEGEKEIPRILEGLKGRGIMVQSVSLKRATLDDVFLKYAGKRIGAEESAWQATRRARGTLRRLRR